MTYRWHHDTCVLLLLTKNPKTSQFNYLIFQLNLILCFQLVHPYRQPRLPDLCSPDNGGCSHICLAAPHWSGPIRGQYSGHVTSLDQSQRTSRVVTTCACPPHMTLLANKRTCVSTGVLIYCQIESQHLLITIWCIVKRLIIEKECTPSYCPSKLCI